MFYDDRRSDLTAAQRLDDFGNPVARGDRDAGGPAVSEISRLDRTKRTNNVFENSVRIVVVDFAHVSASYGRRGCKIVTPYNIIVVVYSVRKKTSYGRYTGRRISLWTSREHTRDARSLAPGGNKRLLDGSYNDRLRRTGERSIIRYYL